MHTPSTTEKRVVQVCVSRGLKPAQNENRNLLSHHNRMSLPAMQNVHCGMLVVKLAAYSFADSVTHIGDAVAKESGGHLAAQEVDCGGGREKRNLVVEAAFDGIDAEDDDARSESDDYSWRLAEEKVPKLNDLHQRQLVGKQREYPADLNTYFKS